MIDFLRGALPYVVVGAILVGLEMRRRLNQAEAERQEHGRAPLQREGWWR